MPENGSGRLDRIEAILERLAEAQERDHKEVSSFAREANERMTRIELSLGNTARSVDRLIEMRYEDRKQAIERDEQLRSEMAEREKRMDECVAKLVSAIGELIRRLPVPGAQQA
jgi:translation initiation factor 2B subunit (eIF-2B alpha/beta/delta family)